MSDMLLFDLRIRMPVDDVIGMAGSASRGLVPPEVLGRQLDSIKGTLRKGVKLPEELREKVQDLVALYVAAVALFPDDAAQRAAWVLERYS